MIKEIKKYYSKLLYDGEETQYYEFIVTEILNSTLIKAEISDFKWLFELEEEIGSEDFQMVLTSINFKRGRIPDSYGGTENLALKYYTGSFLKNIKFLIIVSTGEFQPGRYKIFLEGIWEIVHNSG